MHTLHFATCHLQNSGLGFFRCVPRAVIVSVTNDGRQNSGLCCHTTWMRKTIKRRSVSLHPKSKIEGSSGTAENSQVSLSRWNSVTATRVARNVAKLPRVQETYTDTPLLDCSGRETIRENGEWKALAWVCLFAHWQGGLFFRVRG